MTFMEWLNGTKGAHQQIEAGGLYEVRVLWSQYVRERFPDRRPVGEFLAIRVQADPSLGSKQCVAKFIEDFEQKSQALVKGETGAVLQVGDLVPLSFFVHLHLAYRVVLFGENHINQRDVDAALSVVGQFLQAGKIAVFMLEHLPGAAINKALKSTMKGETTIEAFLTQNPLEIPGKGTVTPLVAWEKELASSARDSEGPKLIRILNYARDHGIAVYGHDMEYQEQIEYLQQPGSFEENEREGLRARDEKMARGIKKAVEHYQAHGDVVVFGFVGSAHLAQVEILRDEWKVPFAVVGLNLIEVVAVNPLVRKTEKPDQWRAT